MASTYSTNLALELIGTGDQAGTWGVTTNTNLGTLLEQAISGYVTQAVSTGTDTTITIPNGSTGVARNMYIELTGTGGTNTNLIVPANKKLYFIFNNASGAVTVKVSGQTGVSVPTGKKMLLVSNGTDIVNGVNYIADFGTNSFTVTNLTATSATITNLIATTATVSDLSATVLRAASASITNLALTSLTISSLSITNVSVASATVSSNLTLSGGTANGVLYLNGSKVATSGSALTFDGTNLKIGNPTYAPNTNLSGNLLQIKSSSGFSYLTMGNGDGVNNNTYIGSASSITTFGTVTDAGATTELMRLTSTGLGIGTSSPAVRLDVYKAAAQNNVAVRADSGQTAVFNAIGNGNTLGATSFDMLQDGSSIGYLFNRANAALVFGTNNAERMRLDSSGNLGLGVTPTNNTLGKSIQNGQASAWVSETGSNRFWLASNWKYDGSDKYLNNGFATLYSQQNGQHQWLTAASGTINTAISFTQAMTLDASGRLLVGATSASSGARATLTSAAQASGAACADSGILLYPTASLATGEYAPFITWSGNSTNPNRARAAIGAVSSGTSTALDLVFLTRSAADASEIGTGSERARITSGGDLLVGTTSAATFTPKLAVIAPGSQHGIEVQSNTVGYYAGLFTNTATSGDNYFLYFGTEANGSTQRGSITYNRAGGLVAYNTTSDYRSKDILGPVQNCGATIDALKVYEGQMKGATQSRPMLVAHEAQEHAPYAVTGEKDAVNEDGTPKYQQMDVSALVPLLLAEIQSLRARVAQLESK